MHLSMIAFCKWMRTCVRSCVWLCTCLRVRACINQREGRCFSVFFSPLLLLLTFLLSFFFHYLQVPMAHKTASVRYLHFLIFLHLLQIFYIIDIKNLYYSKSRYTIQLKTLETILKKQLNNLKMKQKNQLNNLALYKMPN